MKDIQNVMFEKFSKNDYGRISKCVSDAFDDRQHRKNDCFLSITWLHDGH